MSEANPASQQAEVAVGRLAPADLLGQLKQQTGRAPAATRAARPRNAATLIILDRSGAVPMVLVGKRHASHVFMPGKYVFPGGRVDPADRRMAIAGTLAAPIEAKLAATMPRASNGHPRALALAAIRETFEETGLLIGVSNVGPPPNPPTGAWSDFSRHGVFPSLEPLHLIARAITPPARPRRFDVTFFAVDATEIAHRIEDVTGPTTELVELVWMPLSEAPTLDLPPITIVVLHELAARLEAGMGHELPVPFYHVVRGAWRRDVV